MPRLLRSVLIAIAGLISPLLALDNFECRQAKGEDLSNLEVLQACSREAKLDIQAQQHLQRLLLSRPDLFYDEKYQDHGRLASQLISNRLAGLNEISVSNSDSQTELSTLFEFIREQQLRNQFYPLLAFLAHPQSDIREDANKTIAAIGDDRVFTILVQMLSSADALERTYGINLIFHLKDERTFSLLVTALEDADQSVRFFAIESLLELKNPKAVNLFAALLANDSSLQVRIRAAEALGELRSSRGFQALRREVRSESLLLRQQVVYSLAKFRSFRSALVFSSQLSRESDPNLKIFMMQSLLNLKSSGNGRGLLFVLANEQNNEVLSWAIFTSGQLNLRSSMVPLIKLTEHETDDIRAEAAMALERVGTSRSSESLIRLLKSEQETFAVRYSALQALVAIDEPKTYSEMLDIALKTKNYFLKKEVEVKLHQLLKNRHGVVDDQ